MGGDDVFNAIIAAIAFFGLLFVGTLLAVAQVP